MQKKFYLDQAILSGVSHSNAEKILCRILGCSKEHLFRLSDIAAEHLYEFQKYLYEFQKWLPEAYIFWEQEFYGRNFFCGNSTLIPRKETELLVDVLKNKCLLRADMKESSYIDVGTGTSCILTTLVLELQPLQFTQVYWIDISDDILDLAKKNIVKHGIDNIILHKSSLLWVFLQEEIALKKNIYISANLPYIKNWDTLNMWSDVVSYEPDTALYGWVESWFEMYESLFKECFLLKKIHNLQSIHVCIEIWFDQYELSKHILQELWLQFEYFPDIHNIQRIIYITGF